MSLLPGIILWTTDGSETFEPLVMPWSPNPVLDHETQNSSAFNPNPPTTINLTWLKFDGSQWTLPWFVRNIWSSIPYKFSRSKTTFIVQPAKDTPDSVSENGRNQGTQQVSGATSPLDKTWELAGQLFLATTMTTQGSDFSKSRHRWTKQWKRRGAQRHWHTKHIQRKKAKRIPSLQAKSPKQGGRGLHATTQ